MTDREDNTQYQGFNWMLKVRWIISALIIIIVMIGSGCIIWNTPAIPTVIPIMPTETLTMSRVPLTPIPPTGTPLPQPTGTPTLTATQVWVFQSGLITCPILLYHRIADPPMPNSISARYYIPSPDFEWQMQILKTWGYTTIPISLLMDAITTGAPLPFRPVVITFDDGDGSVYENAYPIMQAYGFTGVMYLVGDYIGSQGYMNLGQIQTMVANGWEIGSHSMTHPHLPAIHDQVNFEAGHSKAFISSETGVRVDTFAYPFGEIDPFIVSKIAEYGYLAAVGLGTQYVNSLDSLYYLSRIEVRNGTDLTAFAALLPWSSHP